ncbi:HNH endonuclease [Paenibacillus sp. JJ-100]|uniref:HNH endonuclease n=1 Tax=Paenibacillus sp. JJ-100 TaxID=2974896 RepID=UPI003FA74C19
MNERERKVQAKAQQAAGESDKGMSPGTYVGSDGVAGSASAETSSAPADQTFNEGAGDTTSSGSQRRKRRRRRKKKPSELMNAQSRTSAEAETERQQSTDQHAVDSRPGGEHPPGEGHSQGVAVANAKGREQRARKRAAAAVPAAEQASAAQALLPAVPQGPAAAPAPEAADQPSAARRTRQRRRKRAAAAALASSAGQSRSGAAEAPAPHSSRSPSAGIDGRPRRHHSPPAAIDPDDPASLRTNRQGMVRMRGKTDKGRRWHQEVDMELAVTLVKEKAAVVVNRYTIRRLFSNKEFKRFILNRDEHTCYFCGSYGDTIDHLLPRAKGGHTTPLNCVCACNLCNQSKAAMDADEFMRSGIPEWNAAHKAELLELSMQGITPE